MSLEERSPKRQRRSYSPASPPETKPAFVAVQQPHTPPSSVHMSVSPSWQSQQSTNTTGAASRVTFPTPPSTVGFQSQTVGHVGGSEGEMESGSGTPLGVLEALGRSDGDGDVDMGESMDAGHRRTDHDRQEGHRGVAATGDAARGDGKAVIEDPGSDSPPPPPPVYKLAIQPIAARRPHPSEDLIGLYDLRQVQASVARKDPISGDKINKLRKSYEGKVKNLGIEGRNKATARPGELFGLVDPLWDSDVGGGMTMWQGRIADFQIGGPSTDELLRNLDSALSMKAGRMGKAEHQEWSQSLGLDDKASAAVGAVSGTATAAKTAPMSFLSKTAPATALRASEPSSPRNSLGGRPERSGKKRRYDESSYTGYQEGYDDDGYSTGGMDDRRANGVKRQKRKDYPGTGQSPSFAPSNASNSMVGVRSS